MTWEWVYASVKSIIFTLKLLINFTTKRQKYENSKANIVQSSSMKLCLHLQYVKKQNHQHETHTNKDRKSERAPCLVICCNLSLWQFNDFGVELAEPTICLRSFQPPAMAGNNTDTPTVSSHAYRPTTCECACYPTVVNISKKGGWHGCEF